MDFGVENNLQYFHRCHLQTCHYKWLSKLYSVIGHEHLII